MRAFKNLDYFRKISPEHSKPTVIGGLVSMMCMASISALVYFELNKFWVPEISKESYIAHDAKAAQHVGLNIDIDFFNVPCWMIDIAQKSQVQTISGEEVNKKIEKRTVT